MLQEMVPQNTNLKPRKGKGCLNQSEGLIFCLNGECPFPYTDLAYMKSRINNILPNSYIQQ